MKRDTILEMQKKNGVRPSVFNRMIEGPPLGFEKKISSKEQEDEEIITDYFESSFEDSLEAICGVISILPTECVEDYQNRHILRDYVGEDYFDDLSLSPKALQVTRVSYYTPHQNVAVFDPPTDDMRYHMKATPLENYSGRPNP